MFLLFFTNSLCLQSYLSNSWLLGCSFFFLSCIPQISFYLHSDLKSFSGIFTILFSSQFSLVTQSSHFDMMLPLVQHTGYEEILNSLCRTDFTLSLEVGYDINMALVWRQISMLLLPFWACICIFYLTPTGHLSQGYKRGPLGLEKWLSRWFLLLPVGPDAIPGTHAVYFTSPCDASSKWSGLVPCPNLCQHPIHTTKTRNKPF